MNSKYKILITCEHGGANVPKMYASLFKKAQKLLKTHRGSDMGALTLAQSFAQVLKAPLFASTVTRLLVDLNRSVGHKDLYSEISRPLPAKEKIKILETYWKPHRNRVEKSVHTWAKKMRVIHLASHSFTPQLHRQVRKADVAFLYDPARMLEKKLAQLWAQDLKKRRPDLLIRRNYPYQGKADGLMKTLRTEIAAKNYVGIELEVNQKHVLSSGSFAPALQKDIIQSFQSAVRLLGTKKGR